ncbi:MAG: 7-cyano-7-deazaguanine synthase QueC, partial [Candidatus Nanoarchaeia archaeon]
MKKSQKKKAVVLLSGGMDSATCLAVAINQNYDCYAISFDYGQRHACELESARKIAKFFKVTQHLIVSFDMRKWGGSALTSENIKVPEKFSKKIPVTYVPARNTIFLAFGTSWAETIEARDIFIGVNSIDYSGYPDCRPNFIKEFEKVANLGTKAVDEDWKFKIHAPLQFL